MQHSRKAGETGVPADCLVFAGDASSAAQRQLVAEEPLRIVVAGRPVATLMRTPGNEVDLALGFALTEGIIRSPADVGAIFFCAEGELGVANEVRVELNAGATPRLPEHRMVLSSCGICGASMIEEFAAGMCPFDRPARRIAAADIFSLAENMKRQQVIFRQTGGTHAAALARPPIGPESGIIVREDLGRHNALDKSIGAAAQRHALAPGLLLVLSGRLSFEMVAKAARAGVSDVAGVSAPSGLAVGLARSLRMFLAGFVRDRTMTVYSGAEALRPAHD